MPHTCTNAAAVLHFKGKAPYADSIHLPITVSKQYRIAGTYVIGDAMTSLSPLRMMTRVIILIGQTVQFRVQYQ